MVLHPDSREITTHQTLRGPRRFTRIIYGTKSAAEIFQEEISEALDGLEGAINISDDTLLKRDVLNNTSGWVILHDLRAAVTH